jgi:hypothetical protein
VVVYLVPTLILILSILLEGYLIFLIVEFSGTSRKEEIVKFKLPHFRRSQKVLQKPEKLSRSERILQVQLEEKIASRDKEILIIETIRSFKPDLYPIETIFGLFLYSLDTEIKNGLEFQISEKESFGKYQISFTLRNKVRHYSNMKELGKTGYYSDWINFKQEPSNLFRNWNSLTPEIQNSLQSGFRSTFGSIEPLPDSSELSEKYRKRNFDQQDSSIWRDPIDSTEEESFPF